MREFNESVLQSTSSTWRREEMQMTRAMIAAYRSVEVKLGEGAVVTYCS